MHVFKVRPVSKTTCKMSTHTSRYWAGTTADGFTLFNVVFLTDHFRPMHYNCAAYWHFYFHTHFLTLLSSNAFEIYKLAVPPLFWPAGDTVATLFHSSATKYALTASIDYTIAAEHRIISFTQFHSAADSTTC